MPFLWLLVARWEEWLDICIEVAGQRHGIAVLDINPCAAIGRIRKASKSHHVWRFSKGEKYNWIRGLRKDPEYL
jgi:hypothetical protein